MIRVLIVDDHKVICEGIARLLGSSPSLLVVGAAQSGAEAIEMVQKQRPNVVLMDVIMSGMDGIESTARIVRIHPSTRVIALTEMTDSPIPDRMLEAGAQGFLSKSASSQEIIQAITRVASGGSYLSPSVAQKLAFQPWKKSDHSNPFETLSSREMQVTLQVIRCQRVSEISRGLNLSPKTINGYRYRVFQKLGVKSDLELAFLAIRYGLIGVPLSPNSQGQERFVGSNEA